MTWKFGSGLGENMNQTAVLWYRTSDAHFLKPRSTVAFLLLLISCGVASLAQNVGQRTNSPAPLNIRTTHLLGFQDVSNNANGTLSFKGDALQFQKGDKPAVQVKISSAQDVFLGNQSKEAGGLPLPFPNPPLPSPASLPITLLPHPQY